LSSIRPFVLLAGDSVPVVVSDVVAQRGPVPQPPLVLPADPVDEFPDRPSDFSLPSS